MSKPIFISHSVKDKKIADKIVDLIETGVGIPSGDVFCSSLEGLGIPSGVNFVSFIKGQIQNPKTVLLLITPNYYESAFCLCELGASWALSHNTIPIIVEPLEYKDIKNVLTGIQVRKITDKTHLNEIQAELINALQIKGHSFARWEAKRDEFLEGINEFVPVELEKKTIEIDKYDSVVENYDDAKNEVKKLLTEIRDKENLINELKAAKDKTEVQEIISKDLDIIQKFEQLKEDAASKLDKLPQIVIMALFHYYREEDMEWPGFGYDYQREEIKEAIESDYLEDLGERGVTIVEDDPKIRRSVDSLNDLATFLETAENDEVFTEWYNNNFDHRINFQSKRFWEAHLF